MENLYEKLQTHYPILLRKFLVTIRMKILEKFLGHIPTMHPG